MDLVDDCKLKVAKFGVKELKDLLSLLGLADHGRKRTLLTRISHFLTGGQGSSMRASRSASSETFKIEEVAKLIADVHRNMVQQMYESAVGGQTRCPCGSPSPADYATDMVECKNPDCRVVQHKICVLGLHAIPSHFKCEVCRINRADLIWVGEKNLVHPTRLELSEIRLDFINNAVNLNTEFQIQDRDKYLIDHAGHEVQVWCMHLNDAAKFRMHWPKCSQLEVNGIKVNTVVDRSEYELLGANNRDRGVSISRHLKEGSNKIYFSAREHRIFCLGVRLVKRRTVEEVCQLLTKEEDEEGLNDAKEHVIRCVRGGTESDDNADRDLEVLSDSVMVDIRCPISGARMKTASKFKLCVHMGCFDLRSFLTLSQTTRVSKCPICLKNYAWEDIIVDPYFNQIIRTIEQTEDDTTKIKIMSDGSWFANNGSNTSLTIHLDSSSTSRTTNFGASLEDPMVISDSE